MKTDIQLLIENSLYQPGERDDFQKSPEAVTGAFVFNFLGTIGLLNVVTDASKTRLKAYFKRDKRVRISNIGDGNNDTSLAISLMLDRFKSAQVINEMTRFLAKLKTGQVDNVNSSIVRDWMMRGLKPQWVNDLPPKLKAEVKKFLSTDIELGELSVELMKIHRQFEYSGEFGQLAKRMKLLPAYDDGTIDSDDANDTTDSTDEPTGAKDSGGQNDTLDPSGNSTKADSGDSEDAEPETQFGFSMRIPSNDEIADAIKGELSFDNAYLYFINYIMLEFRFDKDRHGRFKQLLEEDKKFSDSSVDLMIRFIKSDSFDWGSARHFLYRYLETLNSDKSIAGILHLVLFSDDSVPHRFGDVAHITNDYYMNYVYMMLKIQSLIGKEVFTEHPNTQYAVNSIYGVREFARYFYDKPKSRIINSHAITLMKTLSKTFSDLVIKFHRNPNIDIVTYVKEYSDYFKDMRALPNLAGFATKKWMVLSDELKELIKELVKNDPNGYKRIAKIISETFDNDNPTLGKVFFEYAKSVGARVMYDVDPYSPEVHYSGSMSLDLIADTYKHYIENENPEDLFDTTARAILFSKLDISKVTVDGFYEFVDTVEQILVDAGYDMDSVRNTIELLYMRMFNEATPSRLYSSFEKSNPELATELFIKSSEIGNAFISEPSYLWNNGFVDKAELNPDIAVRFIREIQRDGSMLAKLFNKDAVKGIYRRAAKDSIKSFFFDLISNAIEKDPKLVDEYWETMDSYMQKAVLDKLIGEAILVCEVESGVIKPFARMNKNSVKQILAFNDFDMTEARKRTKLRRKKKEPISSYMSRVKEFLENEDQHAIGPLAVTPVEMSDVEMAKLNHGLIVNHYAGKHGAIYPHIRKVFDVHLPEDEWEEFKRQMEEEGVDNEHIHPAFHGTGGIAATMILRFGFKVVTKSVSGLAVTGKMLGNGVYFSNMIDKATQYVSNDGYGRRYGQRGYIFYLDTQLGARGRDYKAAGLGNDGILSPEWAVYNPRGQIKILRAFEVELTSPKRYKQNVAALAALNEDVVDFGDFRQMIAEAEEIDIENTKDVVIFTFLDGRMPMPDGSIHDVEENGLPDLTGWPESVEVNVTLRGVEIRFNDVSETNYYDILNTAAPSEESRKAFIAHWNDAKGEIA